MDAADEARTIGKRVRQVRESRRKTLRVLAGLAGMSTTRLWRIEHGEYAPNLVEISALAEALQIAPSKLTRLPVPAPANGHTDAAEYALELALSAVSQDLPGGQVLPVAVLRSRVLATVDALCRCDQNHAVSTALSGLIRDLHSSIAAGRDVGELLPLAVLLHTQVTVPWLRLAGAPLALCTLALALARRAAQDHDSAAPLGLVAVSSARVALAQGSLDLAQASLNAITVPTTTPELMQVAGFAALRASVVAAVDNRQADTGAALEYAAELAERTGEGNAYGLGFGPLNVGLYRMSGLVEAGDYEQAVLIAESLNPEAHVNRSRHTDYWADYGRALARVRGRREHAVMALRRAELISPHRVLRDSITRGVIAELLPRVPRDSSAGRELVEMAYRARLPM